MSLSTLQIQEHVLLAPYTTLRIGGAARFFCEVTTEAEVLEAVHFARARNLPIFLLGGGSNLLISDTGFDGLVLHIALRSLTQVHTHGDTIDFTASAGTAWDAFTLQVCEQGITGIECLAGIPGTIGGTPVQNVGAYGQEVADTIVSIRALDLEAEETGAFITLTRDQCHFAYRSSIFNTTHRNRYLVTEVTFRFNKSATPNLTYADLQRHFAGRPAPNPLEIYHAVRAIRHSKGMLLVEGDPDCRSAGSFFKNPIVPEAVLTSLAATLNIPVERVPHWPATAGDVKLPAAWLLEQAGFQKGFTLGAVGLSSRHTLALVNRGTATYTDIVTLRDTIQNEVCRRFNIQLEQEPVTLS